MIIFSIKEGIKSIGREKLSFTFALLSMTIGLLLIQFSIFIILFSQQLENKIKEQFVINIFLDDGISKLRKDELREIILKNDYALSINYISKDEAAKKFIKETGEDFRDILDYNPLPASFVLNLKPEMFSEKTAVKIIDSIKNISGVNDVQYKSEFIAKILSFIERSKTYIFSTTIILILLAFYIVFSNLKLIIYNRLPEIETMKLVGAKLSVIKLPIIFNGIITGIIASGLAALFIVLIFYYSSTLFDSSHYVKSILTNPIFLISFVAGPLIGLLGSIFASRGISLKV